MARFIVTEIEGYRISLPSCSTNSQALPGLSAQVIDTAWNHRVMFSGRTEDLIGGRNPSRDHRRADIREQARVRCAELNAEHAEAVAA